MGLVFGRKKRFCRSLSISCYCEVVYFLYEHQTWVNSGKIQGSEFVALKFRSFRTNPLSIISRVCLGFKEQSSWLLFPDDKIHPSKWKDFTSKHLNHCKAWNVATVWKTPRLIRTRGQWKPVGDWSQLLCPPPPSRNIQTLKKQQISRHLSIRLCCCLQGFLQDAPTTATEAVFNWNDFRVIYSNLATATC